MIRLTSLRHTSIQIHLARKAFKLYDRNWFLLVILCFLAVAAYATAIYFFVS